MPKFTAEHPREKYTVQGMDLTMPSVYSEGYMLNANDARWLNSNVASVVGNAYGGDVRRGVEALNKQRAESHEKGEYRGPWEGTGKERKPATATVADLGWDHQAKIDEKYANYELGITNRGQTPSRSPLDEIANKIGQQFVRDYIRGEGRSVKTFIDTKNAEHGNEFNRLVADYIDEKRDEVYAQAQEQLAKQEANRKSVKLNLGTVGVKAATAPAPEPAAAAAE